MFLLVMLILVGALALLYITIEFVAHLIDADSEKVFIFLAACALFAAAFKFQDDAIASFIAGLGGIFFMSFLVIMTQYNRKKPKL